ncbi:MAG TPA: hypothetical protein PLK90_02260 [Clostridiales bacterium]|nr:hypothetical protein [Clostridiales bacterium]HQP69200.1 hypothetical protein [Clostridiales bacterium]
MEETIYSQALRGMKLESFGVAEYIEFAAVICTLIAVVGHISMKMKEKRRLKKERMVKVYIE